MNLKSIVEGLLFVVGDEGLTKEQLVDILEISMEEVEEVINQLMKVYEQEERGITLITLGNHLKLITKKENKPYIQKLMSLEDSDTLSESALEVLAIVAYNQPITRSTVDEIRGISSSHMIRKLVYKDLICEVGRSESAGRPILYGTTDLFLDYFGLQTLEQLPVIEKKEDDTVHELYHSKYVEEENI